MSLPPAHRRVHRTTALFLLGLLVGSLPAHAVTQTRTSAFTYDASTGLLTKELVEPDNAALCLVADYTYDGYGNKLTATTRNCNGTAGEAAAATGDPVIAARTSTNVYDARGQFPTTSTNALAQSETKTYDPKWGAPLSLTGPNGLTTTWTYDSFGRKSVETHADGTQTKWDYLYCTGINGGTATCPTVGGAAATWLVKETPLASDGLTQSGPISTAYYDALNRPLRKETQGYDGSGTSTLIYQDTQYDSLGRPYMSSRPYYAGQTAYWTTLTYDALGRPIQETAPDSSVSSTAYNGLTTTVTNAKSQTRTTVKNSQGQIVRVTDAQNQSLTYTYDPFGNLASTTDPLGNIVSLTYDLRGRKTQMHDPDMGTWTYAYDALGQLLRQTDAKAQVSTLAYDKLGRLTTRSEADLISNWYYDTYKGGVACNKGIGKLCQSETSTGYNKTTTYDSLGRQSASAVTIDVPEPYSSAATYDTHGRVATQTYPTGLAVKYVYTALGYLKEVRKNSSSSNALYWQANSQDAEGHLLQQTYGNNVVIQQTYTSSTGRISAIVAGAGNSVQNLTYQYDALGNVISRSDANQSLTESFVYDSLNRLTSGTVNSSGAGIVTQTFEYDALGGLTSKSDLGTYTYPVNGATSVHPHAVSQITLAAGGSISFAYDANGALTTQTQVDANQTSVPAKSRSQFYTSFGMPQSMGQGTTSAAFYYGPEHQRVKQLSSVQGTTIYVNPGNEGALFFEKDVKPDNSIEQRNFISAGGQAVAIVKYTTQQGQTVVSTRYLQRDHLGSVTAITNEEGAVIERLAYEAFGKRRLANGTAPNGTILPQNTDRGFTDHEMLDEIGLVHMNGRVYDPQLGRFMSADPNVQDPKALQSFNRYAYVWNNPLNMSDPSGFEGVVSSYNYNGSSGNPSFQRATEPSSSNSPDSHGSATNSAWSSLINRTPTANSSTTANGNGLNSSSATNANSPGVQAGVSYGQLMNAPPPRNFGPDNNNLTTFPIEVRVGIAAINGLLGGLPNETLYTNNMSVMDPKWSEAQQLNSVSQFFALVGMVGAIKDVGVVGVKNVFGLGSAAERAKQIADTLGNSQRFITIGVTDTKEGVRIISSSENALRPAALNALTTNEIAVTGAGHAEVTGINAAKDLGLTPIGTAASRPICSDCAQFLQNQSVSPLSPLK